MVNRSESIVLSREAKTKMRSIMRSISEERKRFIQENERQAVAREEEKRRIEVRCRRYTRLMRKGFATLTALARSTMMRKFFRGANRGFCFYGHGGPYSDSPIVICLFPDRIWIRIVYGSYFSSGEFEFPFNTPKKYEAWISEEIFAFERVDVRKGYDDDVPYESCVLSVLIDCADSKKFGEHLADALKANR